VTYALGARSLRRLEGVHPDLVRVVKRAISNSPFDFTVTEGLRTLRRQQELFAQGASATLNSRHLTGHAVDLAVILDGEVRWDWPLYTRLHSVMADAARIEKVPIEWGGSWKRLKDGPHFQLPWKQYPAQKKETAQ
jgi:peptidoglycan L-alanyl-D-glutamate endopeptidase CwlK